MSEPTSLYRHFDASGCLLYVGISLNAFYRLRQHSRNAGWVAQVCNMTIENFSTREEAVYAEQVAIRAERPKHNVIYNDIKARVAVQKKAAPAKKKPTPVKIRPQKPIATDNRLPPAPPGDRWLPTVSANAYVGHRKLPPEDAQAIYIFDGVVHRGQRLWLKSTLDKKFMKLPKYVRDGLALAA